MIEFEIFRRLFADCIRVELDWQRLGDASVTAIVARSPEELHGWYAPWYRNAEGACRWSDPGARPIPVTDPELQQSLAVAELATQMRAQRSATVQVLAAAYRVPGGQLVLDGNHRLAGALGSGKRIAVLALSIDGPLDPEILPDLMLFLSSRAGSSRPRTARAR